MYLTLILILRILSRNFSISNVTQILRFYSFYCTCRSAFHLLLLNNQNHICENMHNKKNTFIKNKKKLGDHLKMKSALSV